VKKHLVIPDTQVKPGVPLDHLEWCGKYIVAKKPDVVVMLGDFADMESLCSYDIGKRSFEGRRYKKDIEVVQKGMAKLLTPLKEYNIQQIKNHHPVYKPRMVMLYGNHENRILRAIENDAKLEGMISLEDLRYKEWGWEVQTFLEPIKIDGIMYSHFFVSGSKGNACISCRSILNKYHMSCFAGHQQGRDIVYALRGDGKTITVIIAGSFYLHEEAYLDPVTNRKWKGIYVLHEVEDGEFDEMAVSIGYLERKYG